MQTDILEHLLEKAKELEKKYEWLQAIDVYKRILDFASKENNLTKLAEFEERIGFCYFISAFQAQSNKEFKKRLTDAILSIEKTINILHQNKDRNQRNQIDNLLAKIAYANSWFEIKALKKVFFLEKWWILKSNVLKSYEQADDQFRVAKTCNDMIEESFDYYYWSKTNWKESKQLRAELISLGEKAIKILLKFDDTSELARAYCWTSWLYSVNNIVLEEEKTEEINKAIIYSQKAVKLSQKTKDPHLIGWSLYPAAMLSRKKNDYKSSIELFIALIEQGKITKNRAKKTRKTKKFRI